MGVMQCNRNGCNTVLCNLLSDTHGYICTNCYNELMDGAERNVKTFMNSLKDDYKFNDYDSWVVFLNKVFNKV